jgi:hypothetical protein
MMSNSNKNDISDEVYRTQSEEHSSLWLFMDNLSESLAQTPAV